MHFNSFTLKRAMLTSLDIFSENSFLFHVDSGIISHIPEIRYCLTTFNLSNYQDQLFKHLIIPFPQTLTLAVDKRRAEYLAARYAARCLLQEAGCQGSVGSLPNRAPLWPAGWRGSISHTDEYAIAVIVQENANLSPGIDIEKLDPTTMLEIASMFTTPGEQSLLARTELPYETALLIAFSSKESLFKALYPEVNHFFGFDAAQVCHIDVTANTLTLELTRTLAPGRTVGCRLYSYFTFHGDKVITLVV